MMSWPKESHRHALAARGIRTCAIPNPIASPKLHMIPEMYTKRKECNREFVGSGLKKIDSQELIEKVSMGFNLLQRHRYDDETYNDYLDMMVKFFHVKGTNKKHIRNIIDRIINTGIEIDEIYIYGSRVTGFFAPESDIDVAVIIKPKDELKNLLAELIHYTSNPNSMLSLFIDTHREVLYRKFGYGRDIFVFDEDGNRIDVDDHYIGFEKSEMIGPNIKIWEAS